MQTKMGKSGSLSATVDDQTKVEEPKKEYYRPREGLAREQGLRAAARQFPAAITWRDARSRAHVHDKPRSRAHTRVSHTHTNFRTHTNIIRQCV